MALYPNNDPRNLFKLIHPSVDLVAAHTPHAHGLSLLCGRPLIVHRRTDIVPKHPWKYHRAQKIIAVSARIREILIATGLPPEKVVVVHSGVKSRAGGKNILDFPRPIYGAIGALAAHKGHEIAIAALRQLPGSLVIAGEGEQRAFLMAEARRLGVESRVFLLGQREDVSDLLASFDVFVHPSHSEGLGQVIAEALSAGSKVVASATGGIPEVVGTAGILVPPGHVDALAQALQQAIHLDPRIAIAQAQHFSAEAMARQTSAHYETLFANL